MSKTKIEWCARPGTIPETWNPTTGCNKVSQGCKNCYAEIMHKRLQVMKPEKYSKPFLDGAQEHHDWHLLTLPFRWKKPRTVFVNSMSDLFHRNISFEFIDQVFSVMALTQQHTYIILTKRPERMHEYFSAGKVALIKRWGEATYNIGDEDTFIGLDYDGDPDYADSWINNTIPNMWPLANVWLGTSVENQQAADERIPYLMQVPAAVRFISCEPLLGPVDLSLFFNPLQGQGAWVIAGGESGHHARPLHLNWVRNIQIQCEAAQVPFFFKQWGEWAYMNNLKDGGEQFKKLGKHKSGRMLDGKEYNQWPK